MQTEEITAADVLTEPHADHNTSTGIGNIAEANEELRDRAEVSRSLDVPAGAGLDDHAPPKPARRRAPNAAAILDFTLPPTAVVEAVSSVTANPGTPVNLPADAAGIELTEDPEFRGLCPPLSEEAYQLLKSGIDHDGQLSALTIWVRDGKKILLDGYNRHKILQELSWVPLTVEVQLENREDAVEWVIHNQLARRNLSPRAEKLLRGRLYNARKGRHGGARQASDQSDHLDSVAVQIGKETGVSPATVRRDARFAEAAEKMGVTQELMAGTDRRSAKEIVDTAFPSEEDSGNIAPATPAPDDVSVTEIGSDSDAVPKADLFRSSAIYPHVQAAIKAIRRIRWEEVPPAMAEHARREIEAAFPEAVPAEEKPAAVRVDTLEKPRTKRSKKSQTQPGQGEFGFIEERHASC